MFDSIWRDKQNKSKTVWKIEYHWLGQADVNFKFVFCWYKKITVISSVQK